METYYLSLRLWPKFFWLPYSIDNLQAFSDQITRYFPVSNFFECSTSSLVWSSQLFGFRSNPTMFHTSPIPPPLLSPGPKPKPHWGSQLPTVHFCLFVFFHWPWRPSSLPSFNLVQLLLSPGNLSCYPFLWSVITLPYCFWLNSQHFITLFGTWHIMLVFCYFGSSLSFSLHCFAFVGGKKLFCMLCFPL